MTDLREWQKTRDIRSSLEDESTDALIAFDEYASDIAMRRCADYASRHEDVKHRKVVLSGIYGYCMENIYEVAHEGEGAKLRELEDKANSSFKRFQDALREEVEIIARLQEEGKW